MSGLGSAQPLVGGRREMNKNVLGDTDSPVPPRVRLVGCDGSTAVPILTVSVLMYTCLA